MPDFFHGIRVLEPAGGARAITTVASAVIGLVATGGEADVLAFPLNKPVLVTNVRAAIGKAGALGTLPRALAAIADQASPVIVVVRIADAADVAARNTAVIGGFAGGVYTGMQALLAAQAQLGVRPRILGAPGLDTPEVTTALAIVARQLRGMVYARAIGTDVAAAVLYGQQFAARELMLIWPDTSAWAGDAVARALGLRAQIDATTGWHKTLSNVPVAGVLGLARDVFFDLQSAATDAGLLNAGRITTIVQANGYRFWGNRTRAEDGSPFAFEAAVRTAQILQDTMADALMWAVDQPLTAGLIRDMLENINAEFRSLTVQQRIIGAVATFDATQNDPVQLAAGRVVLDYDFTPCAPAESLTLNQRITDRFYASVVSAVAAV